MSSILDRIVAHKREALRQAQAELPLAELRALVADAPPVRDFFSVFRAPDRRPKPRIIAEIKRRSPTAGEIRKDANAVEIAQQYERAGAAALSVLSDETFFGGSHGDVASVRAGSHIPILRKDFLLHPYDVVRSRSIGADAVLLIVAVLSQSELEEMRACADELKMTSLVEVGSPAELERALEAGARLVGVNHRDLRTFEIDTTLSAKLRLLAPPEIVMIGESGIKTAADLERLAAAGLDGALVGETLMRAPDPGAALRNLIGGT